MFVINPLKNVPNYPLRYQFVFEIESDIWTRMAIDSKGDLYWLPMIPLNQNRYLLVP